MASLINYVLPLNRVKGFKLITSFQKTCYFKTQKFIYLGFPLVIAFVIVVALKRAVLFELFNLFYCLLFFSDFFGRRTAWMLGRTPP